jgi:hypothetical protein
MGQFKVGDLYISNPDVNHDKLTIRVEQVNDFHIWGRVVQGSLTGMVGKWKFKYFADLYTPASKLYRYLYET